ncbi:hypothetical protein JW948_18750 [bacterium]|nr:hypothetical protein [bacterium]
MNQRLFLILIFTTGLQVCFAGHRRPAWQTPRQIQSVLAELNLAADPLAEDPDLPVPVLDHEKPYTRGVHNTVTWVDSMAGVYSRLQTMQRSIQFFAVEAAIAGADTVWGFVDGTESSATFTNMPEGVPIAYRIRYYAADLSGAFSISPWSRAEVSIQDASAPVIESIQIHGLQDICTNPWVLGPQIRIDIHARDMNGQIMQMAIQEISDSVEWELFDNLDAHPRARVDTTLQYEIRTDANQTLTLNFWAVDVAEFNSDTLRLQLFYQIPDPAVTCFPNPFAPAHDRCISIKIEKENVQEAMIFDPFGNLVRVLRKATDVLVFQWDGTDEQGRPVSKGGYLCVIDGNRDLYCKIAVIR